MVESGKVRRVLVVHSSDDGGDNGEEEGARVAGGENGEGEGARVAGVSMVVGFAEGAVKFAANVFEAAVEEESLLSTIPTTTPAIPPKNIRNTTDEMRKVFQSNSEFAFCFSSCGFTKYLETLLLLVGMVLEWEDAMNRSLEWEDVVHRSLELEDAMNRSSSSEGSSAMVTCVLRGNGCLFPVLLGA